MENITPEEPVINKRPWYKTWWGIILTIVLFPILVPYLVWTKTTWHVTAKIATTVVCALFLINSTGPDTVNNQPQIDRVVTSVETAINNNDYQTALNIINESKKLTGDRASLDSLETTLQRFLSQAFLMQSLINLSEEELSQLEAGELAKPFFENEQLNVAFTEKLRAHLDRRQEFIDTLAEREAERIAVEKAAQEAAKEAARKEVIQQHFSAWDGSHRALTKVIKASMHNPDSYEHVETRYNDYGDYLVVRTSFRGTNGFGGVVLNLVTAKVSAVTGEVLEIINQN